MGIWNVAYMSRHGYVNRQASALAELQPANSAVRMCIRHIITLLNVQKVTFILIFAKWNADPLREHSSANTTADILLAWVGTPKFH